jgi:hypothetical protein
MCKDAGVNGELHNEYFMVHASHPAGLNIRIYQNERAVKKTGEKR